MHRNFPTNFSGEELKNMEENIARRFEKFGTLQAKQSDNPAKKSDIRSSVFSIPGNGNYDTMINHDELNNIISLYADIYLSLIHI